MNSRKSLLLVLAILIALLALATSAGAQPLRQGSDVDPTSAPEAASVDLAVTDIVGRAISYQGQLNHANGNPAQGSYSFRFSLWDAVAAGNQSADILVQHGVYVDNGRFTTRLDFGDNAFTGEARYLQVDVKPDLPVGGQYVTLTPRQPLLPVPYALSLRPGARVQNADSSVQFNRFASGAFDVTFGVYGVASPANGIGHGLFGKSETSLGGGVVGVSESANGYGVWAQNTEDGIAVMADGSVKSTADTVIAISPLKAVEAIPDPADIFRLQPSLSGYLKVSVLEKQEYPVVIPVDLPATLLGMPLKVKSIQVCHHNPTGSSGAYITETIVRSIGNDGTVHDYIDDGTDRNPGANWRCYTSTASHPAIIDGSMLIIIRMAANGELEIGKIMLTLTEN